MVGLGVLVGVRVGAELPPMAFLVTMKAPAPTTSSARTAASVIQAVRQGFGSDVGSMCLVRATLGSRGIKPVRSGRGGSTASYTAVGCRGRMGVKRVVAP